MLIGLILVFQACGPKTGPDDSPEESTETDSIIQVDTSRLIQPEVPDSIPPVVDSSLLDSGLILIDLPLDSTGKVDSLRLDSLFKTWESKRVESDTTRTGRQIKTPPQVIQNIPVGKVISVILFLVFSYLIIASLTRFLYFFGERNPSYRIRVKGAVPIVRIISWTLVIYIIIVGIIHPTVSGLLALATSLGVAVGFASQDILKNIFGGIMILVDRPFIVGDKIEVGNYYGEVTEIGLRSTRIVTPDDNLVSIPNSEMMNSSVSNANAGERNCQVVAEIFLPITIDTAQVRKIAVEAAQVSSYVYLKKPIVVLFFMEMREVRAYYKMRLKAYVMDIRHEFQFKSDMTEILIRELIDQGVLDPEDII